MAQESVIIIQEEPARICSAPPGLSVSHPSSSGVTSVQLPRPSKIAGEAEPA